MPEWTVNPCTHRAVLTLRGRPIKPSFMGAELSSGAAGSRSLSGPICPAQPAAAAAPAKCSCKTAVLSPAWAGCRELGIPAGLGAASAGLNPAHPGALHPPSPAEPSPAPELSHSPEELRALSSWWLLLPIREVTQTHHCCIAGLCFC